MTRNLNKTKASYKRLILGLFISLLLPTLYVILVIPYVIRPKLVGQSEIILGLSILWIITAILLIHIRLIEKRKFSSIGFKPTGIKQIGLAAGVGLLCSLLIPLFYYGLTLLYDVDLGDSITSVSQQSPTLVLIGIITAAVTEELLMRAYPLERIYELTGRNWLGILLSLVAFILLHSQSWNLLHILGVVLPLGIILTIIYLKTRNLLFVILVHFMIDFPLFVNALLEHG